MSSFPKIFLNKLWHSTSKERYELIIKTGAILPEPSIPDKDRWFTAHGSKNYPYVRTLGGISLFDFIDFNLKQYRNKYTLSSFDVFIPVKKTKNMCAIDNLFIEKTGRLNNIGNEKYYGNQIWIEINRDMIQNSFIAGHDLLNRWKKQNSHNNIMPIIEAAHIGEIEIEKFNQVIQYTDGKWYKIR